MITKWRQLNNYNMNLLSNAIFYEGLEHNKDDRFSLFPFLKLHRALKNSTPVEN